MAFAVERTLNTRKKKPKVSKARTKADRAQARKRMGDEPFFNSEVFIEDLAERKSAKINAYNWYSYFFEYEEWHPVLLDYAEHTLELKADSLRALKALDPKKFLFETNRALTAVKLMRMNTQGWQFDTEEWELVQEVVGELVARGKLLVRQAKQVKAQPKVEGGPTHSPLVEALDALEDSWIRGEKTELNLAEQALILGETKQNLKGPVRVWLETRLEEYRALRAKEDDQLVEGYSLTRSEVRRRLTWLESSLETVDTLLATKRRRSRAPKVRSADAQIKKFKCQSRCDELGLQSVQPELLVGAKLALLYNTAYRTISLYEAADEKGLQVQRTKLINYKENPRKWRLRKPSQTLTALLEAGTVARVGKVLEGLTTAPRAANGRSNEQTILLKVLR